MANIKTAISIEKPIFEQMNILDPHVVIQNNLFNRSRINTVVVYTLGSTHN